LTTFVVSSSKNNIVDLKNGQRFGDKNSGKTAKSVFIAMTPGFVRNLRGKSRRPCFYVSDRK
jgi:hypothetical protein